MINEALPTKSLCWIIRSGIYIILNSTDKRFFIGASSNALTSIADELTAAVKGIHNFINKADVPKLEVEFIQETEGKGVIEKRLLCKKFKREWEAKGYTDYKILEKGERSYIIKVELDQEDRLIKVYVGPKYRAEYQTKVLVGVFGKMDSCEEFIAKSYPNKRNVLEIVYADNALTEKYLKK